MIDGLVFIETGVAIVFVSVVDDFIGFGEEDVFKRSRRDLACASMLIE
jgi:hypothetical protein